MTREATFSTVSSQTPTSRARASDLCPSRDRNGPVEVAGDRWPRRLPSTLGGLVWLLILKFTLFWKWGRRGHPATDLCPPAQQRETAT